MCHRSVILVLAAAACAACAAPLQRAPVAPADAPGGRPPVRATGRPTIGVALGGGSARGIAHVGVIRWLEEHRIPIDVLAGTSMGGLVGGGFATGMDARELEAFIHSLNWDQLFGASSFAYKNIRRKDDARDYPSRLEFGLKGGVVPPAALNNGEYVELMLARVAAPYFAVEDFDDLPTPFRTIAVDLLSARAVVLRNGSLADAMRATMSLPLIFPPVEIGGRVLVDGGMMNNVPADVVRTMGADRVIAVNVGSVSAPEEISHTMFGVAGSTIDAMMRASTARALAAADVVVDVPLEEYGSLDWRRAADLMNEGYRAAEAGRDRLLPFALGEAEYAAWREARESRRRRDLPAPAFVESEGFVAGDQRRLEHLLGRHLDIPIDVEALERDVAVLAGLDRYQTVTWGLRHDASRGVGLRVRARVKPYAPPFLMLGLNLENTTSSDFRVAATARYLAFDTVGAGSELRIDATIGSDPGVVVALYRPVGTTSLFLAPFAAAGASTFNFIEGDAVQARYGQTKTRLGLSVGITLGAHSDLRVGGYVGHTDSSVEIGDPGLPELSGAETGLELVWRADTQDSPVVPSTGVHSMVRLTNVLNGADPADSAVTPRFDTSPTQLSAATNRFWSAGPRDRLFLYGAAGLSFGSSPAAIDQFTLGTPFRLGAYDAGEVRGDHYYAGAAGYLRRIGRLPDFLGGPVFAGGWVESGDAFDDLDLARWRTNAGAGLVMDTLVGPVLLSGAWSFDGRWRTYVGVGRLFR